MSDAWPQELRVLKDWDGNLSLDAEEWQSGNIYVSHERMQEYIEANTSQKHRIRELEARISELEPYA